MLNENPRSFTWQHTQSLMKVDAIEDRSLVRPDTFDKEGNWCRVSFIDCHAVLIKVSPVGEVSWCSLEDIKDFYVKDNLERLLVPMPLPIQASDHLPANLAATLRIFSPLVHVASASLCEALVKAIIRQVITARHAKALIHRFIVQFGERVYSDKDVFYAFPTVEKILSLSADDLLACGFGFKAKMIRDVIRRIADDDLETRINNLPSTAALSLLQDIKGIGDWTARVCLCDLKGDWSLYPFDDLAVRTWARKLWPTYDWPSDPKDFGVSWQQINGVYVGCITFYFLKLGNLVGKTEVTTT